MKFKKGDKVRCLRDSSPYFTKGKIYEVSKYPNEYNCLSIFKDDECKPNGWLPEYFESVEDDIYCTCKRCPCCGKIIKEINMNKKKL